MDHADLLAIANAYLEENWEAMVDDVAQLCSIASFAEPDRAEAGAPFGPGPKTALGEALAIAQRLRFETTDQEGYVGLVDLEGKEDAYIGIIGHVDVVPAGTGWHFQPYDLSLKEDHLVGRGVLDDKGPILMALHAMQCLRKAMAHAGEPLRYPIRLILGTNEESGMEDAAYYRSRYPEPAFLFTPDARFPVCYGEKGVYQGLITSLAFADDPVIAQLEGGMAVNAVPGEAEAVVRTANGQLPEAEGVSVRWEGEDVARIHATGRTAHASTPEAGVSAIARLVSYLLDHGLCSNGERAFLSFLQKMLESTDGSGIGLAASDEHFGPLTVVGGVISMEGGRIRQTMDVRFPASLTAEEVEHKVKAQLAPLGATMDTLHSMDPHLMDPDGPAVRALLRSYRAVTGSDAKPYTSGGASYARQFAHGVAFGAEMPDEVRPSWAGSMHGPDEAVSVEALQQAFKAYVLALYELQSIELA